MGPDPASRDPDCSGSYDLERDAHIAVGDEVFTSSIGEIVPAGHSDR